MEKFYSDPQLNEIANEVVKIMPSLRPFYLSAETLTEYSERINIYQAHPVYAKRQIKCKKLLNKKIQSIFNHQELSKIHLNIDKAWSVIGGSIDHHGILNHPFLVSIHLVYNFYKLFTQKENGDILTFATGNVPLNEPFRKRGFMFRGRHINLFPKVDQHKVVYGLHIYDFDIVGRLKLGHQWHLFSQDEQKFLQDINELIHQIDFSTCKTLGDQITKINFYLWPLLFKDKENLANFMVLEDDVFVDYLIHVLQNDQKSFIFRMLFDEVFRKKVTAEFSGVFGAWDEEREIGTYFFWALDEKNERMRLALENGYLIGKAKEYRLPLEPEEVIHGLQTRKLLPGMFLKFSLIIIYMGMKTFNGFSAEYLSRIIPKMIKILASDGYIEAELVKDAPLDNMNIISLCKGLDEQNQLKDIYAFDVFYQGGFSREYFQRCDAVLFKDLLISSLPLAYQYGLSKFGDIQSKKEFMISEEKLQAPFQILFGS